MTRGPGELQCDSGGFKSIYIVQPEYIDGTTVNKAHVL